MEKLLNVLFLKTVATLEKKQQFKKCNHWSRLLFQHR